MLKRKKLSEINHKGKRIKKGEICLKKKKMRESIFRNWSTGLIVECLPMVWETGVQSQIESYKTQKMVLNAALLKTQHYKVWIKGKVEQ